MAEAVVSFGVEKLWELVSRESSRLNGINEQTEGLMRQLGMLRSLLKDADAKKNETERVRNLLEDVKDIVYDAEDTIESFTLNKRVKRRIACCCCLLVDHRRFAVDIESITKRITEVITAMQSLGIIIEDSISSGHRSVSLVQREIRQTFPNNFDSSDDLVGLEESVKELVHHLVEENNNISISGMGGIGKTTLARQVFHHDIVRRHFDGFTWVCVSQQFSRKDIWRRILQDLRPHRDDDDDKDVVLKMDEYTLQSKLFELLETGGRYLIVLDDIWKDEDWDRIKAVFPRKRGQGWRMLLTSRNEGVGLHADPTCFSFRSRTLTPQQSWILCCNIIFPSGFRIDEELEAMGKKMVTYCGGLPLAVKVLGGLLAKKKHSVLEWRRVYNNIGTQIVGTSELNDNNSNSVYRILSLSYEDLPTKLKYCFLYLAHFPEDYKIQVKTLFNYWFADGIIDGSTIIQDSGEIYLEELVRRNMVIVEESYLSSRIEYCQLHDMMREVCLSKAKEDHFLQIVKVPTNINALQSSSSSSRSRIRKLVVHSGNALDMLGDNKYTTRATRSVLVFGVNDDNNNNLWKLRRGFSSLPLLRVLDLSYVRFQGGKLPSSIGELIHLRFLSLHEAGVIHIPSSLKNLKLLLYLNLGVVDVLHLVHVPNVIKEMQQLRYLVLPCSMHDKTKLELRDLVHLESLKNFSTKHINVADLLVMTKLRVLTVIYTGRCSLETLSVSLRGLRDLETLGLYERQKNVVEMDMDLDFIHLKDLTLSTHMPRFPEQYRFPPNLSHIWLIGCRMEEDPMTILEKLLHLKSVYLSSGAFIGKTMVCSNGGFPKLRALKLSYMKNLEEWKIEQGSFPSLRTLTIDNCKKLKQIPIGLSYITSLKELKIERMNSNPLVPTGQDYYIIKHIPSVQFINCC